MFQNSGLFWQGFLLTWPITKLFIEFANLNLVNSKLSNKSWLIRKLDSWRNNMFHVYKKYFILEICKTAEKLLHLPQVDTHSHINSFNVKLCLEMLKLHFAHFPFSCNICIFVLSHYNCGKIYSTIKFCRFGQYSQFQHHFLCPTDYLQISTIFAK